MEQRLARITTNGSDPFSNVGSAISSLISPNPFKPVEGEEIICARFASKYSEFGQSLIMLGYQDGFQVWNLDIETKQTREMVSLRTGARVLAIEYLEYPESLNDNQPLKTNDASKGEKPDSADKPPQQEKQPEKVKNGRVEHDKDSKKQNQKNNNGSKQEQEKPKVDSENDVMRPCVFVLQCGAGNNSKNGHLTGSVYSLYSGKIIKELKFDTKLFDFEIVRISKYFIAIVFLLTRLVGKLFVFIQ